MLFLCHHRKKINKAIYEYIGVMGGFLDLDLIYFAKICEVASVFLLAPSSQAC